MIDRIIIFICCTMIAAIGIAAWSYMQHPGRFVVSKQIPKIVNYDSSAGELVTFELCLSFLNLMVLAQFLRD